MVGKMLGGGLPSALWTALLTAGVIAGCGGGDEKSAQDAMEYSKAAEPPKVFAERMARLIATTTATKDCAQIEQINDRSASDFPCPAPKDKRKSMSSFKVVGAREYGTGAIVDYKSGAAKDGAAIVLSVTPDRNWGVNRFGVITKPSVNTSDKKNRAGYDRTIAEYLAAIRKRNCTALTRVAFAGDAARKETICADLFAASNGLAKRLKANPSAHPKYEGGNGAYGFYTVETTKPVSENMTISIAKSGTGAQSGFLVLNVTSSPTAAMQRQVLEQYRKRQKLGNPYNMEPSSKPSDPATP